MILKPSLLAAGLMLAFGSANAFVLDFGNGPAVPTLCSAASDGTGPLTACGNSAFFNQAYGDVAGVVDVGYSQPLQTSATSLRWWASDYNNLYGVLWADGGDGPASHARIELTPLNGNVVTLTHFDLGAYANTTRATIVDVYDIGSGTSLFHFAGNVGNGTVAATPFNLNLSSASGLRIDWRNSAYNVGIDNIAFTAAPVPEPETYALMLAGLGLVAAAAKRRRA